MQPLKYNQGCRANETSIAENRRLKVCGTSATVDAFFLFGRGHRDGQITGTGVKSSSRSIGCDEQDRYEKQAMARVLRERLSHGKYTVNRVETRPTNEVPFR